MSIIIKDPGERLRLRFDFTTDLLSGEQVTAASMQVSVPRTSVEKNPGDLIEGLGIVVADGVVQYTLVNGKHGVTYRLKCLASTNQNNEYAISFDLPVGIRFGVITS